MRTALIAFIACCLPLGAYAFRGWASYDSISSVRTTPTLDEMKSETPPSAAHVAHEGKRIETDTSGADAI